MQHRMLIGGEWVYSHTDQMYAIFNPGNEEEIAKVPLADDQDTMAAIDAARTAFDSGVWSGKTPAERSLFLWKLADLVERNTDKLADMESANQGKTLRYAKQSDMPFIIDNLRYFASCARNLEGKAASEYSGLGMSMIRREPIGVVSAILPWNYPLYIAVWKIAPALAAGNTVVVKPASLTPLTLLELGHLCERAGLPKGVLNIVTGHGDTVGREMAANNKTDMITFTGDTDTGKKIMGLASTSVKRVELELGGKAPMIVYNDANIEMAAQAAIAGGFFNNGQDCTAVTRIFVENELYYSFIKRISELAKTIRVGNQLNESIDMGPMVSRAHLEKVMSYIRLGQEEGAKLVHGGQKPKGHGFERGFWVEPTIFMDCKPEMKICQEEIFGPVLSVMKFESHEQALKDANNTVYGLAASVFTKDIHKAMQTAAQLHFGTVWINEHGVLASEMPHGGFKQSGFGKDLSQYSFDEYTNIKHVYIDMTGESRKSWYSAVFGK